MPSCRSGSSGAGLVQFRVTSDEHRNLHSNAFERRRLARRRLWKSAGGSGHVGGRRSSACVRLLVGSESASSSSVRCGATNDQRHRACGASGNK
jgi:hypothetical protein